MKKAATFLIYTLFFVAVYGQHMWVKKPDLSGFGQVKKRTTSILDTMSSKTAKEHPEYGILPFNAQCAECVELIDKRTRNTRFFVDPYVPGHTFSQTSYFPLHYKNSPADIWRTIDPRLKPDSLHAGVYTAKQQPLPTNCDLNKKSASIMLDGFEFEFNKNIMLYYADDHAEAMTKPRPGNYSHYTIGDQGLEVTDMWQDVDMQQIFGTGEIESDYIIKRPLQVPVEKGYMVIEDHFNLPDGYTFEESENGAHMEYLEFKGDYELKDKDKHVLLRYRKPVYIDASSVGMQGIYKLSRTGNAYILKMLIPVSWLSRNENIYPLTIDPLVSGDSAMGNYISTGLPSADLAFTSMALGSCDYHMSVTVPGMSQLLNTYVDMEYHLTYSNMCGSPPEPAPYCVFSQVKQYLSADQCGQVVALACADSHDTSGLCTTDSSVLLGNGLPPIPITLGYQQFLSCYNSQCADYDIPFTLKNTDSICGDVCGYLCAKGSKWALTIEACTLNASIIQSDTEICDGQTDTFTVIANCGVPPYHYVWSHDGGDTFDTIYGSNLYTIGTSAGTGVSKVVCYVFDSCGNLSPTNILSVVICAGIKPIYSDGFELFPNPAGDIVTIKGEELKGNVTAAVYDITGRQLGISYKFIAGKIELPVGSLSAGMYFVAISTGNQNVILNFVKQ